MEAQTNTVCTKRRIAPLPATPRLARVIFDTKSACRRGGGGGSGRRGRGGAGRGGRPA